MTTTMPTRIALLCTLVLMLLGSSTAVAASHTSFPGVDDSGQSSALKRKDKENKEKPDKGKDKVVPLDEYTVAVSCVPADSDSSSECTFIADGPKGKGKVKVLYVPSRLRMSVTVRRSDAAKATVEDRISRSRHAKTSRASRSPSPEQSRSAAQQRIGSRRQAPGSRPGTRSDIAPRSRII